eukprot:scaffold60350_cov19-Tisochrysis_lutea.AAC.1
MGAVGRWCGYHRGICAAACAYATSTSALIYPSNYHLMVEWGPSEGGVATAGALAQLHAPAPLQPLPCMYSSTLPPPMRPCLGEAAGNSHAHVRPSLGHRPATCALAGPGSPVAGACERDAKQSVQERDT